MEELRRASEEPYRDVVFKYLRVVFYYEPRGATKISKATGEHAHLLLMFHVLTFNIPFSKCLYRMACSFQRAVPSKTSSLLAMILVEVPSFIGKSKCSRVTNSRQQQKELGMAINVWIRWGGFLCWVQPSSPSCHQTSSFPLSPIILIDNREMCWVSY